MRRQRARERGHCRRETERVSNREGQERKGRELVKNKEKERERERGEERE